MNRHVRWLLLSAMLVPIRSASADESTLRLGGRVPAVDRLLAHVTSESVDEPATIDVVVFWASWCPNSRDVLTQLDARRAELSGARILAVATEPESVVRTFLSTAPWSRLDVTVDDDGVLRRTLMDAAGHDGPLPFGFVIERAESRLLWHGPLRRPDDPDPDEAFLDVIERVLSGRYDLDAAISDAERRAAFRDAIASLEQAHEASDVDAAVEALRGAFPAPPRDLSREAISALNGVAWSLVTSEGRSPEDVAAGLRAIELAMRFGADSDPLVIDTHARAVYETGDLSRAHEIQSRAVALSRGQPVEAELSATLRAYAAELGLEPDPPSATPETPEAPSAWTGSINLVFDAFEKATSMTIVRPAPGDSTERAAWDEEIQALTSRLFDGVPVTGAAELSMVDREERVLVLYGTPGSNPVMREVLDHHGIVLEADHVSFGDQTVHAPSASLIAALPSPWNRTLPLVLYAGHADSAAHGLNRIFHGPTAVFVGSGASGRPGAVLSANVTLDADGRVTALAIGPRTLSAGEAIADLAQLHELLRASYAGYDDIAWQLRSAGSSWTARTDTFREDLATRDRWSWTEVFDRLEAYLDPVQDYHFHMRGTGDSDRGVVERDAHRVRSFVARFTDLRVHVVDGTARVAVAPDSLAAVIGSTLPDVEVVGTPIEVAPLRPYLFPTLPAPGEPDDATFLLGVLAPVEEDPPATVEVALSREGDAQSWAIPLHRGRVRLPRQRTAWSVQVPPDAPLPTLSVRTMHAPSLAGLPGSADSLRVLSELVLDLRANGGGSDTPAMQWCSRLSGQPFRWECGASMNVAEPDPRRRWTSHLDGWLTGIEPRAPEPYGGRLLVIIDNGVASSGETFAMLAGQIEGAVIVGENTAGCTSYGNVGTHGPLANSRISLSFGRTRFVPECIRPTREGVGMFPDYWLDDPRPLEALARRPPR